MVSLSDRIRLAWNAFRTQEPPLVLDYSGVTSSSSSYSPSTSLPRFGYLNDRSIISSIYTRISIDVASIPFRHIKVDALGRYQEDVNSMLNSCLTLQTNVDQGPQAFRQDIALSLLDKGCIAIVPVDTTMDPNKNEIFDIFTIRVGTIVKWYPKHVRVCVYNEDSGNKEEITLEKRFVGIVENPLYSVMNAPNSTLQRLIRKLYLLDVVDEQSSSGKLDIIIQLPYAVKSESREIQAEKRRQNLEMQMSGSKYGVAWTDATEKITQLNRPAENNLLDQVKFLTGMLYNQLGITEDVMNGTADEKTMINYYTRTVEPILDAIVQSIQRSFLGFKGYNDRSERIAYFRDPFKLVPVSEIAEIADKFTRNEIFSSNEMRGFMGIQPSKDAKADELRNSNMPQSDTQPVASV